MSEANYNGRQPNNTAYIKNFVYGSALNLWKVKDYTKLDGSKEVVIVPTSSKYENLYVPGDLFVDGIIVNPSDVSLKKNIEPLNIEIIDKLMNLNPISFELKDDTLNTKHFGLIANELEKEYPELVKTKPDNKYRSLKAVNYIEIIPLLVSKIQKMQKEIDELNKRVNN
jgi:hypothetical protein